MIRSMSEMFAIFLIHLQNGLEILTAFHALQPLTQMIRLYPKNHLHHNRISQNKFERLGNFGNESITLNNPS